MKLPIDKSLIDRITTGIKYVVSGVAPTDFFGPAQPMQPLAQQSEGRLFDYDVGYNLNTHPKKEGVSFEELRGFANSYDLLRLVIETRKDQVCKLDWTIKYKDGRKEDQTIKDIQKFFYKPDRENDHDTWTRSLLEDLFVLDAPTIYPRLTRGGQLYSLDLVNGATIKRIIDESGRTPIAPDPAYQQILKGVPASDYTADTLIYKPKNKRTDRIYGLSPVEQIIMTVKIALNRQLNQLSYYEEGSVPEMIITTPENWQPDQIKAFQLYWSSMMEGALKEKRRIKFVPHGMRSIPTKENPLKDEFDDWLARIVCFAFSISPSSLIKQVNRSVAETSQDTAESEGIVPIKRWLKMIHNDIISTYFSDDIEFEWLEEKDNDIFVQAQVNDIYIKNGVLTVNEVRETLGLDGLSDEELTQDQEKDKTLPSDNVSIKMQKREIIEGKPVERDRPSTKKAFNKLSKSIYTDLKKQKNKLTRQLNTLNKKDTNTLSEETIVTLSALLDFSTIEQDALDTAEEVYKNGYNDGLESIDVQEVPISTLKDLAQEYVKNRALELAKLDASTKDMLKPIIEDAITNELTPEELAKNLSDAYPFSKARADVIARTEIGMADATAVHQSYVDSDMLMHKSVLGACDNHGVYDVANASQGFIPIDEAFASGHLHPLYHPNCCCTEIASNQTEEEE